MNERTSDRGDLNRHFMYLRENAGKRDVRAVAEQVRDLLDRLQESDSCVKLTFKTTTRRRRCRRKGLQQLLRNIRSAKNDCDVVTYPTWVRIPRTR